MAEQIGNNHHEGWSPSANTTKIIKQALRWSNYILLAGAILTLLLVFEINRSPTLTGGAFIAVSSVSFVSGVFGCVSSGQSGCFIPHIVFVCFSAAGLGGTSYAIFFSNERLRHLLKATRTAHDARVITMLEGCMFTIMLCIQLIVTLLAIAVHAFDLIDFYEDIEVQKIRNCKKSFEVHLGSLSHTKEKHQSLDEDGYFDELNI
ncbi:hypothetical protein O6H91_15G080000 [Diphasiastrum complanatum]|uniref:Uncharacterized protein n=1 Tax=Diphasiastrum complanatum TaxID=34168 RepID=A0ACC2BK57_DIPCM|nr:hypothetical protein O6H91_15G080000 [Diphasiastrum complanatum]